MRLVFQDTPRKTEVDIICDRAKAPSAVLTRASMLSPRHISHDDGKSRARCSSRSLPARGRALYAVSLMNFSTGAFTFRDINHHFFCGENFVVVGYRHLIKYSQAPSYMDVRSKLQKWSCGNMTGKYHACRLLNHIRPAFSYMFLSFGFHPRPSHHHAQPNLYDFV